MSLAQQFKGLKTTILRLSLRSIRDGVRPIMYNWYFTTIIYCIFKLIDILYGLIFAYILTVWCRKMYIISIAPSLSIMSSDRKTNIIGPWMCVKQNLVYNPFQVLSYTCSRANDSYQVFLPNVDKQSGRGVLNRWKIWHLLLYDEASRFAKSWYLLRSLPFGKRNNTYL